MCDNLAGLSASRGGGPVIPQKGEARSMSEKPIVLHNSEGAPCGTVSVADALTMEAAGLGKVIRSHKGEAKRFIPSPSSRIFGGARDAVAALHSASLTTQPIRAGGSGRCAAGQILGDPRRIREHRI